MNTKLDFENLVEVLEDQEDMVECKECFDLFPKAECAKQDIGYICPTCGKMFSAQNVVRPTEYSVFDTYNQEFPDVQEYDPGTTKNYNEEPKIEDALVNLIKDEYEAIEGYEVADETVQNAPISEDEKDDILDTLEHIKEEEGEHIDELKELVDDGTKKFDGDKDVIQGTANTSEDDKKPLTEESEAEDLEETSEDEDEETSDLDAAYATALEAANEKGIGQVFGYARVDTEEFVPVELFDVDDEEAIEADLQAAYDDVKYAFVAYPDKALDESLVNSVPLTEDILVEWPMTKGKARNEVDAVFDKGYVIYSLPGTAKQEASTIERALAVCKAMSKKAPRDKVYILPKAIDSKKLDSYDPELQKLIDQRNGFAAALVTMQNGKDLANKIKSFAKFKKNIDKQNDIIADNSDSGVSDSRDTLGSDTVNTADIEDEKGNGQAAETDVKLSKMSDQDLGKIIRSILHSFGLEKRVPSDDKAFNTYLQKVRSQLASLNESYDEVSDEHLTTIIKEELDSDFKSEDTLSTQTSESQDSDTVAQTLHEEYHKYANPAELKAMEEIEDLVVTALTNIYDGVAAWGYEAEEVDSQSWMCSENKTCLQYMVNFHDLDADEIEDLASQLQMQLENELSAYKPVPEISEVSGSVALPDYDLADEEDEAEGITRASIMVYVTFARNLF